ncbi:MAG: hypothetical protein WCK16_05405 [Candidatus Moraniibacteriota bacterium]
MSDDIGMGNAIADLFYVVLVAVWIFGAVILLKRKFILGAFFWTSSVANLFFYFYFMGNYRFYPSIFYSSVNAYWPILNFFWLAYLVRNHFIIKHVKTKNK